MNKERSWFVTVLGIGMMLLGIFLAILGFTIITTNIVLAVSAILSGMFMALIGVALVLDGTWKEFWELMNIFNLGR